MWEGLGEAQALTRLLEEVRFGVCRLGGVRITGLGNASFAGSDKNKDRIDANVMPARPRVHVSCQKRNAHSIQPGTVFPGRHLQDLEGLSKLSRLSSPA